MFANWTGHHCALSASWTVTHIFSQLKDIATLPTNITSKHFAHDFYLPPARFSVVARLAQPADTIRKVTDTSKVVVSMIVSPILLTAVFVRDFQSAANPAALVWRTVI